MSTESILAIAKAISDYKPALDNNRAHEGGLSSYKVEKPWGHEIWLELNGTYVLKLIHMKAGFKSSLQSHVHKIESNYVLEGKAYVSMQDDYGAWIKRYIGAGDGWTVLPGRKHQVAAETDYTAIEVSSPHLDDVIRYNDEYGRQDGKVEEEHST